jgi:hypothetical protein
MTVPRRIRRAAIAAAALVAAAAVLLPFFELPALAPPLRAALSRSLGRPVELGNVRLALLPVPALLAENLVIAEDPVFGLEPFAYAAGMRAPLRLPALARGVLEVSAIQLTDASLNVARDEQAGFNVAAFLRKAFSLPPDGSRIPAMILKQSRINFRSGSVKSVYYLNAVDLDLRPPDRPGEDLQWRYEASPARTDRAEQGFGRFTGAGRWTPGPGGGRFAVDVALERSAVSELLVLLTGRDLGLQGRFVARAFLDGPFDGLELRGTLEMQELERQAFFDFRSANIQLPFQGKLNLDGQTLALASAPPVRGRQRLPLDIRLEGRKLLTAPGWGAELVFEQIPAEGLLDLFQRLGMGPPASFRVEGPVSGSAAFTTGQPARGRLQAPAVQLKFGEGPSVEAADAVLRLEGALLTLENARITTPGQSQAQVTGSWDWVSERLVFELRTPGMDIAELNGAIGTLAPIHGVPFLEHCAAGQWRGRLGMVREPLPDAAAAAAWTGQVSISDARCAPPWLPGPVRLRKAQIEPAGAGWRLRQAEMDLGAVTLRADARFGPDAKPPIEISLHAGRLTGEDLEAAFRLAQPPRRSLLDRTLRRRAPMPAWLRQLDIGGTLFAETLALGRQEFEDVEAQFRWRRGRVLFHRLGARWKGAGVYGVGEADLWREEPLYRVRAAITGLAAGQGVLDAEVEAASSTLGPALAERARGWAEVSLPLLRLPSGGALRQLHVSLLYDGARAPQPWRLPEISFWMDGQFYNGRGSAAADGSLRAEFPAPGLLWEGSLWPPALTRAGR